MVVKYYKKNWHPNKAEWVVGLQQSNSLTFGNRTNNRLECMNSKVVQVVKRNSKLTELFEDLNNLLISLRTERDSRSAKIQLRVPLHCSEISGAQKKYMQLLTPYAYSLVADQFSQMGKVKITEENGEFTVISREGLLHVTEEFCNCSFFKSMELPCRHVLRVREEKKIDLFSEKIASVRWTKTYYVSSSRLVDNSNYSVGSTIGCNEINTKRVLSQHEKYRIVMKKVNEIASLASEASSRLFPQRMEVLNKIIAAWGKGVELAIHEIPDVIENGNEIENIQNHEVVLHEADILVENEMARSQEEHELEVLHEADIPVENEMVKSQEECELEVLHEADVLVENEMVKSQEECEVELLCTADVNAEDGTGKSQEQQELDMNTEDGTETSQEELELEVLCTADVNAEDETENAKILNNLPVLPPKIRKRGRPKGHDLTVVGLPKKRKSHRVQAFERKHPKEKETLMLQWFVSVEDAKEAVSGLCILDEKNLKKNANLVSSACMDENVHLPILRRFFTVEAWAVVKQIVATKKKSKLWLCPCCRIDCSSNSICCNSCLEWYHLSCMNLKTIPKKRQWFCRSCNTL